MKLLVVFIVAVFCPGQISCCGGFEYKLHYFKPCTDDDTNVIKFKEPSNKIDADCNLVPYGCVSTEGFKSAVIHYRVDKKPMPILEGDFDLCEGFEKNLEMATMMAKVLNIPSKCPVQKMEACGDGKSGVLNIGKFKSKLGMAVGVTVVNVTIKHDAGETCLTLKAEFKKSRRLG